MSKTKRAKTKRKSQFINLMKIQIMRIKMKYEILYISFNI